MNKPELPVLTSDTYQGYSCVYADAGMKARTGVSFGLPSSSIYDVDDIAHPLGRLF
jgi:hypothetical protein